MGATIVSTIVEAFTGITTGIAEAVVDTFNAVVTNGEGGLSALGIWGLVLISVGFGFGLLKKFTNLVD